MFSGAGLAILGSAAIGAGASAYASDKQRSAANSAADKMGTAGVQARSDLSPWRATGAAANSKLSELLGIAPTSGPDWADYLKRYPDVAASSAYGSNAAQHYQDYGKKEGRTVNQIQPGSQSPDFGSLLKTFSPGDLTKDPGYQFGLTQGEKSLNRAASSRGMYFAPETSQALSQFNTDYAGTKYNDAFSRDQASKSQLYGFLSGTSGAGENAAGQTANLGTTTASNIGNMTTSGAAAQAAGGVGIANAGTGAAGQYLNYQNQSRLIDLLNSNRSPTTSYTPNTAQRM